MDLVTPDVGLLFWTVISFFVLLFLLRKFAWKPIVGTVNDRETSIREALESAEKARLEMQNLTADNERILKEAREIKEKMISDAKDEAQNQANKMIEQAQTAIASEKKSAMAELKNHVAALSVDIAEKMVREELSNKDKQLKLVENMLGEAKLN